MRKTIRHIFSRDGFAGLWRWAKRRHAIARFRAARDWAAHRARIVTHPRKYLKAKRVYQHKVGWLKRHRDPKPPPSQALLMTFDGHLVPTWIVADALRPARTSGVWKGVVFSGYRSPEFSTSLCMSMCGAPSCPGRCAGAASNHSAPPTHTGRPFEGAVDVSDPAGLQRYTRAHGNPIRGNGEVLPFDLNHFSRVGN